MGFDDAKGEARTRWKRSQKFGLSALGREIEAEYVERIVASRVVSGRGSFDEARANWAKSHGLEPDDGLYLSEMRAGPVSLAQLTAALESCDKPKSETLAALQRLSRLGFVATDDAPAPP